eukprot:CAMPEP_0174857740 /NCGR_PEP_ID=MMETSP1114-20130205/40023_1 /TAXON_ID=312471 /ORGANISM="Neobodo designis, Strain CCAP 1951/1" /LENGTH=278 /DNA_ID=CAMNT_0016092609 /DNA_START=14 /DNA_END=847 /DNA_ORIENTATION=-
MSTPQASNASYGAMSTAPRASTSRRLVCAMATALFALRANLRLGLKKGAVGTVTEGPSAGSVSESGVWDSIPSRRAHSAKGGIESLQIGGSWHEDRTSKQVHQLSSGRQQQGSFASPGDVARQLCANASERGQAPGAVACFLSLRIGIACRVKQIKDAPGVLRLAAQTPASACMAPSQWTVRVLLRTRHLSWQQRLVVADAPRWRVMWECEWRCGSATVLKSEGLAVLFVEAGQVHHAEPLFAPFTAGGKRTASYVAGKHRLGRRVAQRSALGATFLR